MSYSTPFINWYGRFLSGDRPGSDPIIVEAGHACPDTHEGDMIRFLRYMGFRPSGHKNKSSHQKWVNDITKQVTEVKYGRQVKGSLMQGITGDAGVSCIEFREWLRTGKIKRVEQERKPPEIPKEPIIKAPIKLDLTDAEKKSILEYHDVGFSPNDIASAMLLPENLIREVISAQVPVQA
jgi:hypothetical protein